VSAAVAKQPGDSDRGLKLGVASYSLRKFSLDEAIEITKKCRVRHITLKDMHLPMRTSAEERRAVARKIQDAGLKLMGGGVIYLKNNADEIRAAFDYARDAGMPVIVCSPDPAALTTVEKFVQEYDIKIAIHNHGPGDEKYPSPMDVLRMVRDLDPRMGICMDLGHTVRINQDPLPIIRACAKRLHDFHIKDVTAATEKGAPIEVGRGIIDIAGVLRALLQIKFSGHLALEYEIHPDNPLPGMAESFAYMRGVLAALS
jgi:sugar phosphate isomerase/epimerase